MSSVILCLCACVVLTSAFLHGSVHGANNFNTQGYYKNYNPFETASYMNTIFGYPAWQRGFPEIGQNSGSQGGHSRYRRSTYSQPRVHRNNRFTSQTFDRFGGSQFNRIGTWDNQHRHGNNGFNRQFTNGLSSFANNGINGQFINGQSNFANTGITGQFRHGPSRHANSGFRRQGPVRQFW